MEEGLHLWIHCNAFGLQQVVLALTLEESVGSLFMGKNIFQNVYVSLCYY